MKKAASNGRLGDMVVERVSRFLMRATSPRSLLVPFVLAWSLWQFGAGKALFIAFVAYMFVVTEACREIVIFLSVATFTISSLKWLGIWENFPNIAGLHY
jgi:hypothetical protein